MKKKAPDFYWNYRLMRYDDGTFAIHEVYYDHGKPTSTTSQPSDTWGESKADLKETLELMLKALKKPALDFEDFSNIVEDEP